jgi:hypothetical protein
MEKSPSDRPAPAITPRSQAARAARLAREAEALRANLHKRKEQARARQADKPSPDIKD